ncbi:MAG: hypothetical protein IT361_02405 [Gemmatimonadaceae bacterium]|nr:hypothetical protein [Gemmatimonadaceae bacterium]
MEADLNTRTQLTLFVPEPTASTLDRVRRVLDPVQLGLIRAHVTLCREDEIAHLTRDAIAARLAGSPVRALTLRFGQAEPVSEHGILLPCIDGEPGFQALREHVLGSRAIRRSSAHITLAHPRNPKAMGNDMATARALPPQLAITFAHASLVEQTGNSAWHVLGTFALGSAERP